MTERCRHLHRRTKRDRIARARYVRADQHDRVIDLSSAIVPVALRTTRADDVIVDVAQPANPPPLRDRPTIHLDQNHWSTLTHTIHEPERVANKQERSAAVQLIALATARQVVLPMSSAHMSETCKQVDAEQRYRRALTIAQVSAGWQLREPVGPSSF